MNNKISAVAKAVTLLLATGSTAAHADLVITEYMESGSQKAVEISNLSGADIDLDASQYILSAYNNGVTGDPTETETLTGTLASGESIVFHNGDAVFTFGTSTKVVNFNGDDALVLTKDGEVVDRVGKYGERVKWSWTDSSGNALSTEDMTLRRGADITQGDTDKSADFPTNVDDWVGFEIYTIDGLGCPGINACTKESGSLVITEYIEGSSDNKAVELSNVGDSPLDLDAAEYKLVLFSNGATEPGNTEVLSGTLAAGESIVFHNSKASDDFKVGTASTVTWFNGDDALVLYKDDVVIDRFGKLGEKLVWTDPSNPDFSSQNKTLRRKNGIKVGETDASAPFPGDDNQWVAFEINTYDGLGCSGEDACPEIPVCENCPALDPIADPDAFNREEYYSDVINGEFETAEAMKDAISAVIASGHKKLSYSEVWTVITKSDEDPADSMNVIELYTGNSIAKNSNAGRGGSWNREHVWAKSHGFPNESQLGYTDAHHLRAADGTVNSIRSNYDFDICSDTGEEVSSAPGNFRDTDKRCFEPRDSVKGDVARMILYMDTRYQGNDSNMPDLVAVDRITTAEEISANEPLHGKLCTMYNWHQQDPVDAADIQRNNAVYTYQGNRNPYIDNPEWVKEIYGVACGDVEPTLEVDFVIEIPEQVFEGDSFAIDASQTAAKEGVELSFRWEQLAGPELSFEESSSVLNLVAPEVDSDTQVQFKLTVSDGSLETSQLVDFTIANIPLTLDVSFSGTTELNEGESTVITASIADEPEGLTYAWKQVSGASAEFSADGLVLNVTAPDVSVDQALVFELSISDGVETVTSAVSINVKNAVETGWTKPKAAGSLGLGLLMLLPLAWRRR
ncbi:endonuclease [Paraferrimonas sedimenticola]|uniref:LTD domain-containing protein n=1 Tax=Paraferrimonas sedimenticola TaxID=375674 RepID=A0AA37W065_9GAMM|nr:endonuclease [Paraferrimonas sedimenticola]GLP95068.1 hypothetical protein GCM10007895_03740 [Paraferrimonas sedimenticola]